MNIRGKSENGDTSKEDKFGLEIILALIHHGL